MFCDKCGAQVPDGIRFCGQCGNTIAQQPAPQPAPQPVPQPAPQPPVQQPVYQQPVQQPVYQQPVYQQPMTRDKFIDSKEPKKSLIVRGMLAVCALLIIIGMCTTLWGSILNNATFSTVMTMSGADVSELEEELENELDELEERAEYYDLSNEEEEVLEVMEKVCEKPSIMNLKKVIALCADEEYAEAMGMSDSDVEEAQAVLTVFNFLVVYMVVSFLIGLLFTGLACWKRNTALMVFALLFSVGNCFTALGAPLGLVMLALYIAAIVMNVQLSNQYKAYKASLGVYA